MSPKDYAQTRRQLYLALAKMKAALRILNDEGAPGEIAPYLDLAVARLKTRLRRLDETAACNTDRVPKELRVTRADSRVASPWDVQPI